MKLLNFFKKKDKPTPEPYRSGFSYAYKNYIEKIEEILINYIDYELGDRKLLLRKDVYDWLSKKSRVLTLENFGIYTYEHHTTYSDVGKILEISEFTQGYYETHSYSDPLSIITDHKNYRQRLGELFRDYDFEDDYLNQKEPVLERLNKEIIIPLKCFVDPTCMYYGYFHHIKEFNHHSSEFKTDDLFSYYSSYFNGQEVINSTIETSIQTVHRHSNLGFIVNTIKNLILFCSDKDMDELCTQFCPDIYWDTSRHKEVKNAILTCDEYGENCKLIIEITDLIITYDSQTVWLDEAAEIKDHNKIKIYKKDNQTIEFFDCPFESSTDGFKTLEMFLCGDKLLTITNFKFDMGELEETIINSHDSNLNLLRDKITGNILKRIQTA